jgi:hypothetical protein
MKESQRNGNEVLAGFEQRRMIISALCSYTPVNAIDTSTTEVICVIPSTTLQPPLTSDSKMDCHMAS